MTGVVVPLFRCDECRDEVDEGGCHHDGRLFCRSCLEHCPECLAGMRNSFQGV